MDDNVDAIFDGLDKVGRRVGSIYQSVEVLSSAAEVAQGLKVLDRNTRIARAFRNQQLEKKKNYGEISYTCIGKCRLQYGGNFFLGLGVLMSETTLSIPLGISSNTGSSYSGTKTSFQ